MQATEDQPLSAAEQQQSIAESERRRIAFRRRAYQLKFDAEMLADELEVFNEEASERLQRARLTLFEAWTSLCVPPDEPDDLD